MAANHRVIKGDTLSAIAFRYSTTVSAMMQANPTIKNPNLIYPNQIFTIPNTIVYVVKQDDTLSHIAVRYNSSVKAIVRANPIIKNPNLIYPNQVFIIPLTTAEKNNLIYTAKPGDTLGSIAKENNTTVEDLIRENPGLQENNKVYPDRTFVIPDTKQTENDGNNRGNDNPGTGNDRNNRENDNPSTGNDRNNRENDNPSTGNDRNNRENDSPSTGNDRNNGENDNPSTGNDRNNSGNDNPSTGNDRNNTGNNDPKTRSDSNNTNNNNTNDQNSTSENNKVDSINEEFSDEPHGASQSCAAKQSIYIYPVRYAIDESPEQKNGQGKHKIPPSWGTTGLPEIKTRNYCMRQLRDGWLYVWDGEKFDEYFVKGTDFRHTDRANKTIPVEPMVQIIPTEGKKGTKKYLEYDTHQKIYLGYAQERWTERLYEKMQANKNNERGQWMRKLNLAKHTQQRQPHTALIKNIVPHVADIYQDIIVHGNGFKSTTVQYKESADLAQIKQEIEVKPPLLSSQIMGAVPDKESSVFVALDDHVGILNDLTMQLAGRNLELVSFDKNYQHKLYTASVVEQLCGANLVKEDYDLASISVDNTSASLTFARELEQCFSETESNIRALGYIHANPQHGFSQDEIKELAIKNTWNNINHMGTHNTRENITGAFRKKYNSALTLEWFTTRYNAWVGNSKSRRQVKYQEATAFLIKREEQQKLTQHIETSAKDLIIYLEFIGNNPNKLFLDPTNKMQCELLIVNFTTIQEQICTRSDYGKQWHAQELVDKKTLIPLISYNFTLDWAVKFEGMIKHHLKYGKLEENEPAFNPTTLISRLLAGGNLTNAALNGGIGALGELYQSFFGNSGSHTAGTNNIPLSLPVPTTPPRLPGHTSPMGLPGPTPPASLPAPTTSSPPSVVMQNRMSNAITYERIIQTNVFKNMGEELQQVFLVLDETLGGSKNALDYWQKSTFYRSTVINFAMIKDHRLYLISAEIIQAVLLRGRIELTPVIYTDPYFEENHAKWEQDKIALQNERKPVAKKVKTRERYRGRGKNWNRKLNIDRAKLAEIDTKIAILMEKEPVKVKTTGYLIDNHVTVVNERVTSVKLSYLTIEGFDLTKLTQEKWLGIEGSKIYQNALLSNKPLRQALPSVPTSTRLPVPAINRATNVSQAYLEASVGWLGRGLVVLNLGNCINTIYQANQKDYMTADDIASIASAHAYLGSLLFSFKMHLWESIKDVNHTTTSYAQGVRTTTTGKLINMAPSEWKHGGAKFLATAQEFALFAKAFAILGFIGSGIETIQLVSNFNHSTSAGEYNARRVKALSTLAMTFIAGYQIAALYGFASMSIAFGPWIMAATLVAAAIYFIANFYESYFHLEGFDQWLHYCCWGNNPKWDSSEEGQKNELRSLQELLLQPTVYAIPQIDDYTNRIYEHKIFIIFPPQLTNCKPILKCLLTENGSLFSADKALGGRYGADYALKYEQIFEDGCVLDYATAQHEIQTAIAILNEGKKPEKVIAAPEAKSQPHTDLKPVVWETTCMYDDSVRDERAHNLELEIIYPKEILATRPDGKGYRFKLSDIDLGQVAMGKLTFNNIDPNGLTTNELPIDTNMTARYGIMYLTETNE